MHLRQRGHDFVLSKTFKDVKFTVDCTAFQAFITANEKLLSNASCASRLKQFLLVLVLGAKKSPKLTFTKPKTIL